MLRRINQYFDGKRTDDEILYRAEINRKQLREVLRNYEEYVSGQYGATLLFRLVLIRFVRFLPSYIQRKISLGQGTVVDGPYILLRMAYTRTIRA